MLRYPAVLWLSTIAALLGALQFGYHLGILNTCQSFIANDLHLNESVEIPVVVSAALIGAAIGALIAGQIADKFGPKRALMFNNMTFLLGCLLCATTPAGFWTAVLGRFIAGIGTGAASLYVPRYLAEISPSPSIRGAVTTFTQVFICLGILSAYLVGLPYIDNNPVYFSIGRYSIAWWRIMLALGMLPAAAQMLGLAGLPESPIWLKWKGLNAKASEAEHRLWGKKAEAAGSCGAAEDQPLITSSSEAVEEAVAAPEKGWSEILNPRYRWIMLLTTMLPFLQQLSGINTCILYSSEVFAKAGLKSPVLGSVIMGCVNLGGTLLAAALMDRAGRRLLLLLSYSGMGLCLLAIALVAFIPGTEDIQAAVDLAALQVFVLFFGLGAGPIPWIYLPEVLPNEIKGPGASLGTCINWLSTFLVGQSFPSMLQLLGVGGSYLVYALFNFGAAAFAFVFVVETKQCSLDEIQRLLILGRRPADL